MYVKFTRSSDDIVVVDSLLESCCECSFEFLSDNDDGLELPTCISIKNVSNNENDLMMFDYLFMNLIFM